MEAKDSARYKHLDRKLNIPAEAMMTLSVDVLFETEWLKEAVKQLGKDTVLQPHIRPVRAQDLHDGALADSTDEDAIMASELFGRNVILYLGSKDTDEPSPSTANQESSPLALTLKARSLKCHRESGLEGRDNVLFSWGMGSDLGDKVSHRTPEFGAVREGDERMWPEEHSTIFTGRVGKALAGSIICGEVDHDSSEWLDEVIKAMGKMADFASRMTTTWANEVGGSLIGVVPGFSHYADLVCFLEDIASMITVLLEIFLEPEDIVKVLQVCWTKSFLEEWIGDKKSGVNNVLVFGKEDTSKYAVLFGPE